MALAPKNALPTHIRTTSIFVRHCQKNTYGASTAAQTDLDASGVFCDTPPTFSKAWPPWNGLPLSVFKYVPELGPGHRQEGRPPAPAPNWE